MSKTKRAYLYRKSLKTAYETQRGIMLWGALEKFHESGFYKKYRKKVQLIFTSPPFPLNRKKRYGNLNGDEYIEWLAGFAELFESCLKPTGSIVIEIGNSWVSGSPEMSTLAIKALLKFLEQGGFHLCQQFICYNPARLPSPAQWVNIERIRVKDAFTHIWWMSPTRYPKADNKKVLKQYSKSMLKLLETQKYNSGKRPSEHNIGKTSFLNNNNGAIPSNVLTISNTRANDKYQKYCKKHRISLHPARMQQELPEFFIKFLTSPREIVFDPFAGSNTTGASAEILKRRWISIEMNKEYINGSKGRFTDVSKI